MRMLRRVGPSASSSSSRRSTAMFSRTCWSARYRGSAGRSRRARPARPARSGPAWRGTGGQAGSRSDCRARFPPAGLADPAGRTAQMRYHAGCTLPAPAWSSVSQTERVLDADDLRDGQRSLEVCERHVAQTDARDQPVVPRSDHRRELRVERRAGTGRVHETKVDRRKLVDPQRPKVVFDAAAQLVRRVVAQHAARVVPPRADLADYHEVFGGRVGEKAPL